MVGVKMSKETFALINDQDQVVNHIVVDKDAPEFEQVMADQLAHWECVRYVETTEEDNIILDPSPEIWTTHTEETGFVLPSVLPTFVIDTPMKHYVINGREYPFNSLLIKENSPLRPEGWTLPEGEVEVSLADAENPEPM